MSIFNHLICLLVILNGFGACRNSHTPAAGQDSLRASNIENVGSEIQKSRVDASIAPVQINQPKKDVKESAIQRDKNDATSPDKQNQHENPCKKLDRQSSREITEIFQSNRHKWQFCFERELSNRPMAPSRMEIQINISKSGTVSTGNSTISDPSVAACVKEKIMKLKFPKQDCENVPVIFRLDVDGPGE